MDLRRFCFTVDELSFESCGDINLDGKVLSVCPLPPSALMGLQLPRVRTENGKNQAFQTSLQVLRHGQILYFSGTKETCFTCTTPFLILLVQAGQHLLVDVHVHEYCNESTTQHCIGRAAVPLDPLLSETWVQGKAKVWAHTLADALQPFSVAEVQVGVLGVRIALEDTTPVGAPLAPPPPELVKLLQGGIEPVDEIEWPLVSLHLLGLAEGKQGLDTPQHRHLQATSQEPSPATTLPRPHGSSAVQNSHEAPTAAMPGPASAISSVQHGAAAAPPPRLAAQPMFTTPAEAKIRKAAICEPYAVAPAADAGAGAAAVSPSAWSAVLGADASSPRALRLSAPSLSLSSCPGPLADVVPARLCAHAHASEQHTCSRAAPGCPAPGDREGCSSNSAEGTCASRPPAPDTNMRHGAQGVDASSRQCAGTSIDGVGQTSSSDGCESAGAVAGAGPIGQRVPGAASCTLAPVRVSSSGLRQSMRLATSSVANSLSRSSPGPGDGLIAADAMNTAEAAKVRNEGESQDCCADRGQAGVATPQHSGQRLLPEPCPPLASPLVPCREAARSAPVLPQHTVPATPGASRVLRDLDGCASSPPSAARCPAKAPSRRQEQESGHVKKAVAAAAQDVASDPYADGRSRALDDISNEVPLLQPSAPPWSKVEPAASEELRAVWAAEVARRTRLAVWEHEARQAERGINERHETAWLHAEVQRQRDVRDAATRLEELAERTCQKAEELERREAQLVAAQAAALQQRADDDAAAAAYGAEAQAAVTRLRVECAHQLELEEGRRADLLWGKQEAEEELAEAQADAKAARSALQAAQRTERGPTVAQLRVELAALKRQRNETASAAAASRAAAEDFAREAAELAVSIAHERDIADALHCGLGFAPREVSHGGRADNACARIDREGSGSTKDPGGAHAPTHRDTDETTLPMDAQPEPHQDSKDAQATPGGNQANQAVQAVPVKPGEELGRSAATCDDTLAEAPLSSESQRQLLQQRAFLLSSGYPVEDILIKWIDGKLRAM